MSDALRDFPVDIDRLLDPISAERPAGEYLRYEETYDRVEEQRHADDPALPQGIYEEELDTADWEAVEETCMTALETKTKDLKLAAWLTEAWIYRYHFRGARGGITLLAGLVEGFWDDLYPPIKDGDLEFRLGPIQWIDEKLSTQLKEVPITQPDVSGEADTFTLLDWESTEPGPGSGAQGPSSDDEEEGITRNEIQTSITLTPKSYYRALVEEIDALLDKSSRLERLLWERCGEQTVGLATWKDTLRSVKSIGEQVLSEREPAEENGSGDADDERPPWVPDGEDEPVDAASMQIQSRSEAYRLLWEAAEYLMRTEPHSPTPYLVKRAVSWGNMSLEELLEELLSDTNDLEDIYELLGMTQAIREEESAS